METRQCRTCYVSFEPKRADHFFCSGKCVAKFYRDNPNPEQIHTDLPHDRPKTCEWCGVPYSVNAYADRGGQRTPKYCSGKCKQAAYRHRGMSAQDQARRRYEQDQRDQARERDQARRQRQEQQQEQSRRADEQFRRQWEQARQRQQQARSGGHRASKLEQAAAILGIDVMADKQTIKSAYRKLMKHWHPDLNHSPEALEMSKQINWAYEYMK
jgi:hypothetical protein